MIEVRNKTGKVVFYIDGAGQLMDAANATYVVLSKDPRAWMDSPPQKYWIPRPEPLAHKLLWLQSVSTGLDGNNIATFTVGRSGDFIRWIGKDGMGYWDLWRVAGTRVDKAYVQEQKE